MFSTENKKSHCENKSIEENYTPEKKNRKSFRWKFNLKLFLLAKTAKKNKSNFYLHVNLYVVRRKSRFSLHFLCYETFHCKWNWILIQFLDLNSSKKKPHDTIENSMWWAMCIFPFYSLLIGFRTHYFRNRSELHTTP